MIMIYLQTNPLYKQFYGILIISIGHMSVALSK